MPCPLAAMQDIQSLIIRMSDPRRRALFEQRVRLYDPRRVSVGELRRAIVPPDGDLYCIVLQLTSCAELDGTGWGAGGAAALPPIACTVPRPDPRFSGRRREEDVDRLVAMLLAPSRGTAAVRCSRALSSPTPWPGSQASASQQGLGAALALAYPPAQDLLTGSQSGTPLAVSATPQAAARPQTASPAALSSSGSGGDGGGEEAVVAGVCVVAEPGQGKSSLAAGAAWKLW